MLTDRAHLVVFQATPAKRVSLIVSVQGKAPSVAPDDDRKARWAKLLRFYSRKKKPILKHFGAYESCGLRVVNDFAGTPNMVVSAPARVWKRVMREQPNVLSDPRVEVTANEADFVPL